MTSTSTATAIPISYKLKSFTIDGYSNIPDIINLIRTGSIKEKIKIIRSTPDDIERRELKRKLLPIFFPSMCFDEYKEFNNDSDNKSNGLVQFDIDHILECEIRSIRAALIKGIPELQYLFVSPSGNGLKFAINTDFISDGQYLREEYKVVYRLTSEYIKSAIDFDFDFDDSVGSINSSCYFSSDEDAFCNDNAEVYKIAEKATQERIDSYVDKTAVYNKIDVDGIDEDEVLKALSFIPKENGYRKRYDINQAIISVFGNRAEQVILSNWIHDDKEKLKSDVRRQMKDFKHGMISVGTLFHEAKKHGYCTSQQNQKSKETELPPTFNAEQVSVDESNKQLATILDKFFNGMESFLVSQEAGVGKTARVIDESIKFLEDNPMKRIAIFVPTHALAQEILTKFHERVSVLKKRFVSNVQLTHIHGRDSFKCTLPIVSAINKATDNNVKSKLERIKSDQQSSLCLTCDDKNFCGYVDQFENMTANIRIYTHSSLFQKPSIWDGGSQYDKNESCIEPRDPWKPDYIVVDEDVISNHVLSQDLVERTSYCDGGDIIKSIISEAKKKGGDIVEIGALRDVVNDLKEEIMSEIKRQNKALKEWKNKCKLIGRSSFNDRLFNKRPKVHKVLVALKDMLSVLTTNCDLNFNQIYIDIDKSELVCAPRAEIEYRFRDVPMLLLDASSNRIVAEAAFGNRIKFKSIRVQYQSNVRVEQFENNTYSMNKLSDESTLNKAKDFIKDKSSGLKWGLVTYKNIDGFPFAEPLAEELGANAVTWFNNCRGINEFENLDILFVLGRYMVPKNVLQMKYRQLFGISYSELEFNQVKSRKIYRMRDENHKSILGYEYIDKRMAALANHINSAETYQAAHRLRLIHGDKIKTLCIMSKDVLDITVDELINTVDVFGKRHTKSEKRINEIIDTVKEHGYIQNKDSVIAGATSMRAKDVANLRRNSRLDELLKKAAISFKKYIGVNKSRKSVTKSYLVSGSSEPTREQLGFID